MHLCSVKILAGNEYCYAHDQADASSVSEITKVYSCSDIRVIWQENQDTAHRPHPAALQQDERI